MSNFLDERRYAWRMIRAARQVQSTTASIDGIATGRDEIITLLEEALDAGLDRAELIVELANLGARFFAICDPDTATKYELTA